MIRVNGGQDVFITNLTNAGTIAVNNNSFLHTTGTITNTGSISLNSVGNNTDLHLSADTTLNGGGTLTLAGAAAARVSADALFRLTNVNNLIQGRGQIGVNLITVTNQATINANISGQTLTLDPASATNAFLNTGTLEASSGGILILTGNGGGGFTNTTGTITALDGSQVQLTNGVTITGGTLSSTGSGAIVVNGGQDVFLNSLTTVGTISVSNNAALHTTGTISNIGTLTLNSIGNNTDLSLAADTTLAGGGTVTLSGNTASRITGDGVFNLVNADNLIQGQGQIGLNQITVNNQSIINANISGQTLTLDPANSGIGFLNNNGLIEASNGGILVLTGNGGGSFTNNGTISALDGSTVRLVSGVSITGGTLLGGGTGVVRVVGGDNAFITDLMTLGTFVVDNNAALHTAGTITDSGTITLNSAGNNTDFTLAADTTLAGNGTLILAANNAARVTGDALFRLTNAEATIQGQGQFGANAITITNQASINANVSGQTLTIDPANSANAFRNEASGTTQASNGGILVLSGNGGGDFTNFGTISAVSEGAIQLTGTLNSSGTVDIGSDTLSVTGAGAYNQTAGTFRLAGGTVTSTNALNFMGGVVDAQGSINASITNSANLSPALGGSGLLVTGNVSLLSASQLTLQLGGLTQGSQYSFMNVNGTVSLGGQLVLSFANGFQNSVNGSNSFTVLTASSALSGVFTNVASGSRLNTSDGFGSFVVTYSGSNVVLSNYLATGLAGLWQGGAGNWSDPNWNLGANFPNNGQPNTTDRYNATINSGTVTLNLPVTIESFALNGGILTGTNPLTANQLFTWSAGSLSGGLVLNANGGILFNGAGTVTLDGATLNNATGQTATMNGTGASVLLNNAAVFNNNGNFLAQNSGFFGTTSGGGTINNVGTFTRDTGTGVFSIQGGLTFNNTGTVNVDSGFLSLNVSDNGSTPGDFNVAAGANLIFNGNFNLTASSDLAGAGSVTFSSGTQTLNGSYGLSAINVAGAQTIFNIPANVGTVSLTSGSLEGSGAISAGGLFTWTGGDLKGSAAFNANGGVLINGENVFLGRTLNLAAGQTLTMNGSGGLFCEAGGVVNNNGTFLAQNDRVVGNVGGGALNNTGTFTRNTSSGTFSIGVPMTNSGTVNVNSGTLDFFNTGFTQTAGVTNLNGGNLSSTPDLHFNGGLLTGFGTISAGIQNNAMLQPGLASGGLVVNGNVSLLAASQLTFQLGGLTQGSGYGFLNVNGATSLNGTLVVSFVNGFQAGATDNFTVLSASSLSGSFTNVLSGQRLNATDNSGSFVVTYNGTNIVLSNFQLSGLSPILPSTPQPNAPAGATGPVVTQRRTSDDAMPIARGRSASTPRGMVPRPGIVLQNSSQLIDLMDGAATGADGTVTVHPAPVVRGPANRDDRPRPLPADRANPRAPVRPALLRSGAVTPRQAQ